MDCCFSWIKASAGAICQRMRSKGTKLYLNLQSIHDIFSDLLNFGSYSYHTRIFCPGSMKPNGKRRLEGKAADRGERCPPKRTVRVWRKEDTRISTKPSINPTARMKLASLHEKLGFNQRFLQTLCLILHLIVDATVVLCAKPNASSLILEYLST